MGNGLKKKDVPERGAAGYVSLHPDAHETTQTAAGRGYFGGGRLTAIGLDEGGYGNMFARLWNMEIPLGAPIMLELYDRPRRGMAGLSDAIFKGVPLPLWYHQRVEEMENLLRDNGTTEPCRSFITERYLDWLISGKDKEHDLPFDLPQVSALFDASADRASAEKALLDLYQASAIQPEEDQPTN